MTPEEASWLAGIVDGEGCISGILKNNLSVGGRVQIHITNTDSNIVDRCQELFPDFLSYLETKERVKPTYRLYIYDSKKIIRFLTPIHPYLIAKQEQATLAIGFCHLVVDRGHHHLPEDEINLRMALIRGIQELNQWGHRIRLTDPT